MRPGRPGGRREGTGRGGSREARGARVEACEARDRGGREGGGEPGRRES